MESINNLRDQIDKVNRANSQAKSELLEQAKIEFSKLMESEKNQLVIKSMVSKVESSKKLTSVESDEWYHQFCDVDFSLLIDEKDDFQKQLLQDYFREYHCCDCDFQNEVLTMSIGPCIIVNDDGDVLDQDSGKWFIKKNDYETEDERNELIESHMEKSGCFPSTVRCDYYGNAFYINTKKKE